MHATIHKISIPNPFFEGRNSVYVIKDDPVTLVDTGVATDKAYEHLLAGLHALSLSVTDIKRVVLTHKHIDHIGNAWRVQEEGGADVLIHDSERKSLVDVDPSGQRFAGMVVDKMSSWRVPSERMPNGSESKMPLWKLQACEVTGLSEGDQLQMDHGVLDVIHTPGHTMGSICLKYGDRLFSGDHVLPDISPNVGAGDMRSRGLLGLFLASLEKVRELDVLKVFPGHGEPFEALAARCLELVNHHEQRLEATLSILRQRAASVYDVASGLFGTLTDFHLVLGCAEANAHIELLQDRGLVSQEDGIFHPAA